MQITKAFWTGNQKKSMDFHARRRFLSCVRKLYLVGYFEEAQLLLRNNRTSYGPLGDHTPCKSHGL